jgi:hypothetical protein
MAKDMADEPEIETDIAPTDEGEAQELSEIEQLASELGWKPEAQWKGDKTNWTDAKTFMRQTAARAESAKKEAKDAHKNVDAIVARRVEALERTMKATRDREMNATRQAYNAEIRKAIADGDARYEADLRRQLGAVEQEYEELDEVPLTPEALKAAEDEWVENFPVAYPQLQKVFWNEHAWVLDDDADVKDFALVEAEITRQLNLGKSPDEALEAAGRILRKAFPDQYEADDDPPPRRTARDEPRVPVLASGKRSGGRTLASRLPPEARTQAAKDIKAGLYGSHEEWAEEFVKAGGELR